jgi:hypothetical protein
MLQLPLNRHWLYRLRMNVACGALQVECDSVVLYMSVQLQLIHRGQVQLARQQIESILVLHLSGQALGSQSISIYKHCVLRMSIR